MDILDARPLWLPSELQPYGPGSLNWKPVYSCAILCHIVLSKAILLCSSVEIALKKTKQISPCSFFGTQLFCNHLCFQCLIYIWIIVLCLLVNRGVTEEKSLQLYRNSKFGLTSSKFPEISSWWGTTAALCVDTASALPWIRWCGC